MSSNNNGDNVDNAPAGLSLSDNGALNFEVTDKDVDDALSFDLDFDGLEDMGDALPEINLDGMMGSGSLGTRSPSPSHGSLSDFSKGSKRSRAEFEVDSESDCDSRRNDKERRMGMAAAFPSHMLIPEGQQGAQQQQNAVVRTDGSGISHGQLQQPKSPTKVIRQDREREGRCPHCGLDTHRIVMNDKGFELQPLTIEGEVLNGKCLLCGPLKELEDGGGHQLAIVPVQQGAIVPHIAVPDIKPSGIQSQKKGGRSKKNSGEFKMKGGGSGRQKGDPIDNMEPQGKQSNPPPFSRGMSKGSGVGGGNFNMGSNNMGSPPSHAQQRKTVRMNSSGEQWSAPPPVREGMGGMGGGRRSRVTPTPNQYHSKMALMKQAQLPRKHSAMQHALMAFGNTNNRSRGGGGASARNQQGLSRRPSGVGARGTSGGRSMQRSRVHSSNNSLSSVSCSEVESAQLVQIGNDEASGFSQNSLGQHRQFPPPPVGSSGLKNAMAMGMGMRCAETASFTGMSQQQQRPASSGPQTPHSQRRSPSDPMLAPSGSTQQTPQSVPVNISNVMSNRLLPSQSPQSMPPNMSNTMSSRIGGGGDRDLHQQQLSSHSPIMSGNNNIMNSGNNNKDLSNITGNVPQAVRIAHSKLQSSIYHHHNFSLNEETELAHIKKTLGYLESGSGDIADIIVAMRRFPFSLAIQRISCEKLYAHCFDNEHASAIGLVGGIRTIIDSMEHHPEDVSLQQGFAGVIKRLALAGSYNLEMLDRMGAVGIIVATMERHPNNPSLLESACWAMESMSRTTNPEIKMRVAKGGGIHSAMKAVETFPNNESLLRAAFHCLRQLGYNPSSYNSGSGGSTDGQGAMQSMQRMKQNMQQQHGQMAQNMHQQQHQGRQQHGSNSQQQQQQKQQVPSFSSKRGSAGSGIGSGGGSGMQRGSSGMMMQNNNSMMGGNNSQMPNIPSSGSMMPNNMPNSNSMMGGNNSQMSNMPNNGSMMGGNSNSMMGGNNNQMPNMSNNGSMMGGNTNLMLGGNSMMVRSNMMGGANNNTMVNGGNNHMMGNNGNNSGSRGRM